MLLFKGQVVAARACILQLARVNTAGVRITLSCVQCRSCQSMEIIVPMCVHMQMGTLGAGNHYAEIQVVEEVFDKAAARKMGIDKVGQVCIMIHSGSRGLGHQVTHLAPFWSLHPTSLSNAMLLRCCVPCAMIHTAAPLHFHQ